MSSAYNNIARVLGQEGKYDEANTYYRQSLEMLRALRDTNTMILVFTAMGADCTEARRYPMSLHYLMQALSLEKQQPSPDRAAEIYTALGYYYNDLEKYDSTLYFYNLAKLVNDTIGSRAGLAPILHGLAVAYFYTGKLDKAEEYYKQSIALAKEQALLKVIMAGESDLAELYAKKKDFANAYKYLLESNIYKDSLTNIDRARKLEELTVQFEVKEVENKNELLQNENKLQKFHLQRKSFLVYAGFGASALFLLIGFLLVRQSKLKANQQRMELEQKQLLAQINPHFIFNCLNSIQQFVVQNDTVNANKYLADFALLMRQTLDNSKDGVITLKREIDYLQNYLSFECMRFEDKFHYTITIADDVNINMVEIPSMIIQPFAENAIRHGLFNLKDREGKLSINFSIKNDHLICEVDDNGIGMEESKKIKEQRLIKYQSHGMELTRQRLALVSKMKSGDYKISVINKWDADQKPCGTTIIIKFPLRA